MLLTPEELEQFPPVRSRHPRRRPSALWGACNALHSAVQRCVRILGIAYRYAREIALARGAAAGPGSPRAMYSVPPVKARFQIKQVLTAVGIGATASDRRER